MQALGWCQEREETMWSSPSIRTKLLGLLFHFALGDHFHHPPPANSCSTHLDLFPGPLCISHLSMPEHSSFPGQNILSLHLDHQISFPQMRLWLPFSMSLQVPRPSLALGPAHTPMLHLHCFVEPVSSPWPGTCWRTDRIPFLSVATQVSTAVCA